MNKRQEIALERLFAVDDTHEAFVFPLTSYLSILHEPACSNDWKRCQGEFGETDADNVTKIVQSHAGSARLFVAFHKHRWTAKRDEQEQLLLPVDRVCLQRSCLQRRTAKCDEQVTASGQSLSAAYSVALCCARVPGGKGN